MQAVAGDQRTWRRAGARDMARHGLGEVSRAAVRFTGSGEVRKKKEKGIFVQKGKNDSNHV